MQKEKFAIAKFSIMCYNIMIKQILTGKSIYETPNVAGIYHKKHSILNEQRRSLHINVRR